MGILQGIAKRNSLSRELCVRELGRLNSAASCVIRDLDYLFLKII